MLAFVPTFRNYIVRLFNSLSLENKIWNYSLRYGMQLFVTGEYALAFSFMYHLNDISYVPFFVPYVV